MKSNHQFYVLLALIGLLAIFILKKKIGSLKVGTLTPERKKYLAEQYKAQLDGIFNEAAIEKRDLTTAEQLEVNRLQEKMVELGYIYEIPRYDDGVNHIFTPVSWAFMPFLN